MTDPWAAFQTQLDVALTSYIRAEAINGFSIDPPVFTRLPQSFLDIEGEGSEEEEPEVAPRLTLLSDSTMERIWKDEGRTIQEPELVPPARKDPAGFKLTNAKLPRPAKVANGI